MWEREKERFVIRLVFVLTHHTCIDGDSLLDWQLLLPRFLFFYLRRNIRRKMTFKNRVAFNLFRRDAKIREYTTLAAFKYAFDVSCWPCWERSGRLSYPCRIMLRPSFILHLPVLGVHGRRGRSRAWCRKSLRTCRSCQGYTGQSSVNRRWHFHPSCPPPHLPRPKRVALLQVYLITI